MLYYQLFLEIYPQIRPALMSADPGGFMVKLFIYSVLAVRHTYMKPALRMRQRQFRANCPNRRIHINGDFRRNVT